MTSFCKLLHWAPGDCQPRAAGRLYLTARSTLPSSGGGRPTRGCQGTSWSLIRIVYANTKRKDWCTIALTANWLDHILVVLCIKHYKNKHSSPTHILSTTTWLPIRYLLCRMCCTWPPLLSQVEAQLAGCGQPGRPTSWSLMGKTSYGDPREGGMHQH